MFEDTQCTSEQFRMMRIHTMIMIHTIMTAQPTLTPALTRNPRDLSSATTRLSEVCDMQGSCDRGGGN